MKLSHLLGIFLSSLGGLFSELVSQSLIHYEQLYMSDGRLGELLGHSGKMNWKYLGGGPKTVFYTIFGKVWIPQLIVRLYDEEGKVHTKCVTRLLLEVSRFQRISDEMKHWMGVLSSLCSYRSAQKVLSGLGFRSYALGSFRRAVLWVSEGLTLGIEQTKQCLLMADGTGISTLNTGKRGSELRVITQWIGGKLHLVNIGIGKYKDKSAWIKLFEPIKACFEHLDAKQTRQQLAVLIDGCQSILAGVQSIDKLVRIQRDIWHVTHQLKYYLWKDKIVDLHKITLMKCVFSAVFPRNNKSISERLEN